MKTMYHLVLSDQYMTRLIRAWAPGRRRMTWVVLGLWFLLIPPAAPLWASEHLIIETSGHFDERFGAIYTLPAMAYVPVLIPARGWFRSETEGSPALFGGPNGNDPNYHFSTQLTHVGDVALGNFTTTNIEVSPIITRRHGLLPNGGYFQARIVGPQRISFTWGDFIGGEAQDFTARGYYDPSPTANAGPNQALSSGTSGSLQGTGHDVDNDTLTYQWTRLFGPDLSLSDASTAHPTIKAPASSTAATTRMQLVVRDAHSESIADTVDIVTYPPGGNIPPIAEAGPETTGTFTTIHTLDGSKSSDFDGHIQSYSWTQLSGPKVTLSDPSSAKPTFKQYEPAESDQVYVFELVVSDGTDFSAPDTVSATVTGYHNGPVPAGPREQVIYTDDGSVPEVTQAQHNNGTPPATEIFAGVSVPGAGRLRTEVAGSPALFNGPDNNNPGFHLSSNGARWDGVAALGFRQTDIEVAPVITNTFLNVASGGSKTLIINGPQALSYTFLDYLYGEAQSFAIKVWFRPQSNPPIADAGTYPEFHAGDMVQLDGRGSSDPDGDPLAYAWTQTAGLSVKFSNTAAPMPFFKVPEIVAQTTLKFSLIVNDDQPSAAVTTTLIIAPRVPKTSTGLWVWYE